MTQTAVPLKIERSVHNTLVDKMSRRGHDVHQPPNLSVVAERLRRFLEARISGDFAINRVLQLPGGASKEQFVFDLEWQENGMERNDRMVLRMDPPASMVETPRLREFEALRAVRDVLPVPRVFWATDDRSELGASAMICGYVQGVASPKEGAKTASGLGTTYGARLRPLLAGQFVSHLATLHSMDWSKADLPTFDRPRPGTTDAIDWRLSATDRAWEEDAFEAHPVIALTQQWLHENRPVIDHVSLVHGDYRNGNFLFDEENGRITAILDWELTYLGDRHHDLAYAMMEGWGEVDEQTGEFYCSGLMPRRAFIEQYERESGLPVDLEILKYYTVLNMYWAAVALTATGPRNATERMTHLDVMQVFLGGLGAFYLNQMLAIVEKG